MLTADRDYVPASSKSKRYADLYAKHKTGTGTHYLAFRDVGRLIQRYARGTKILDFGCGAGGSTAFLNSLRLDVDGADINEHMLRHAKRTLPRGNFMLIENGRVPVDDRLYDAVFSSFVLVHAADRAALKQTVREMARVLKPDGVCVVLGPSREYFDADWYSVNTQFEQNKRLESGGLGRVLLKQMDLVLEAYYWSVDDHAEAMREAGLTLVLVHKPLGNDDDGYPWTLEKSRPPFCVYVATKAQR